MDNDFQKLIKKIQRHLDIIQNELEGFESDLVQEFSQNLEDIALEILKGEINCEKSILSIVNYLLRKLDSNIQKYLEYTKRELSKTEPVWKTCSDYQIMEKSYFQSEQFFRKKSEIEIDRNSFLSEKIDDLRSYSDLKDFRLTEKF